MPDSELSYETTLTSDNSEPSNEYFEVGVGQYDQMKNLFYRPQLTQKQAALWKRILNYFNRYAVQNIFEFQIGNEFNEEEVKDLIDKGYMEKRKNKQGLSILKIVI